jgi:pyruvate formate lyase activating enzyme
MLISGVQPFTNLDFPGKIACVMFVPGCNFRCGYCHNPEFVVPERIQAMKGGFITEEAFFSFLDKRRGLLDGVVISGGEPTLAPELVRCVTRIKDRGFSVKLDTNGNRPDVVKKLVGTEITRLCSYGLQNKFVFVRSFGWVWGVSRAHSYELRYFAKKWY